MGKLLSQRGQGYARVSKCVREWRFNLCRDGNVLLHVVHLFCGAICVPGGSIGDKDIKL